MNWKKHELLVADPVCTEHCGSSKLQCSLSHLGLGHLSVHRVLRFEDLLNLLLRSEEGRPHKTKGQRSKREKTLPQQRKKSTANYPIGWVDWRVKPHLRSELLPSLEKVLRRHFSGLEKLVEHHWKFHCNVLQGAAVSAHTRTHDFELAWSRYITHAPVWHFGCHRQSVKQKQLDSSLLLMCRYSVGCD